MLPSLSFDETEAFYAGLGFAPVSRSLSLMTLERKGVALHFWLTANRRIPQASCCLLTTPDPGSLLAAAGLDRQARGRLSGAFASAVVVQDCHGNELYIGAAPA